MCFGQDSGVEKSINGVQIRGYLGQRELFGFSAFNESRLSRSLTLRVEIGIDARRFKPDSIINVDEFDLLFTPSVLFEPRWYFSLNQRNAKGKSTTGNSGSFLSLRTYYRPSVFSLPASDLKSYVDQASLIPSLGLKRSITKNLYFESDIGFGYRYRFVDDREVSGYNGEAILIVNVSFTYSF